MAHVLIVEDDDHKLDVLVATLHSVVPDAEVQLVTSVSTAVRAVNSQSFDLIVLDMALPSHEAVVGGGAPMSQLTGGLELLFELQSLARQDPCVIVTQYPEIEICGEFYPLKLASKAIEERYETRVLGCLEYTDANSDWRVELANIFGAICES